MQQCTWYSLFGLKGTDSLILDLQVFIPLGLYLRVCRIFECVRGSAEKGFVAKQGSKIDYESLALGGMQEVRHIFARIVFDTVYPLRLNQEHGNL